MRGSFRKYAEALAKTAGEQAGYFTSSQAIAAGFADSVHGLMVKKKSWVKVMRGIYRLSSMPEPDWPELTVFSLWSRDRTGCPKGGYTGETARAIHEGLALPGHPVHMTVPKDFRKHASPPEGLILHKEDLPENSWEIRDGYRVLRADWRKTVRSQPVRSAPACRRSYDAVIEAGED